MSIASNTGANQTFTTTSSKKRKKDRSDELLDAAINSLNSVHDEKEGKWDLFGKLVSEELKELEPAVADKTKFEIQTVLFKAKYP